MTTLAHATLVEHQIMAHIKDALRLTLDARVWPAAMGRKLASVQFMADSFERHFERLLDLEEDGGYLTLVQEHRPELVCRVTELRDEHAQLRRDLQQTLQALRSLTVDEGSRFQGLCHRLRDLLERIDTHDANEIELLEQVLLTGPG